MNMAKSVKETRKQNIEKPVINFMGGTSYEMNPIDTLKMVTASSIFGEPSYYREGDRSNRVKDGVYHVNQCMMEYSILDDKYEGMKTSELMEKVIDDALDYDYGATLEWARILRHNYNMRLNPQVIMVRAAMHKERVVFNEANPGVFSEINASVMSRADEPASQLTYYLYRNETKNNLPNILKRNWKEKIEGLDRYQIAKYKNEGLGMIDVVRICHANSELIDELMQNGSIDIEENQKNGRICAQKECAGKKY